MISKNVFLQVSYCSFLYATFILFDKERENPKTKKSTWSIIPHQFFFTYSRVFTCLVQVRSSKCQRVPRGLDPPAVARKRRKSIVKIHLEACDVVKSTRSEENC